MRPRSGQLIIVSLGQLLCPQILKNTIPEKMSKLLRKNGTQVYEDRGLTTGLSDEAPFPKASQLDRRHSEG